MNSSITMVAVAEEPAAPVLKGDSLFPLVDAHTNMQEQRTIMIAKKRKQGALHIDGSERIITPEVENRVENGQAW